MSSESSPDDLATIARAVYAAEYARLRKQGRSKKAAKRRAGLVGRDVADEAASSRAIRS